MAQKHSPAGYMDGVCVKISEKYKPPKRILLPTNTLQRISSNDVQTSPLFNYDFSLEHRIGDKIRELRNARELVKTQRNQRLKKHQEIQSEQLNHVRDADNCEFVSDVSHADIPNTESVTYPSVNETPCTEETSHSNCNSVTQSTLTYPPYPTNVNNILMPTPMLYKSSLPTSQVFSNTINISDFENDTSSPFDNMELKTINDLAELAQVLQQPQMTPIPTTQQSTETTTQPTFQNSNFVHMNAGDQTLPINGYYSHYSHRNMLYHPTSYNYLTESQPITISPPQNAPCPIASEDPGVKLRSVPDIMNELHKDLIQSRVDESSAALKQIQISKVNATAIAEETIVTSKKNEEKESLPNPYSTLTTKLQQMAKEVSLMGFPLDRVSRACSIIGDDQSRLIEHMIAMSQLLDLGFPEEEVTKALLRCNNDRDMALDILIS